MPLSRLELSQPSWLINQLQGFVELPLLPLPEARTAEPDLTDVLTLNDHNLLTLATRVIRMKLHWVILDVPSPFGPQEVALPPVEDDLASPQEDVEIVPSKEPFQAGNISRYLTHWKDLFDNQFILRIVKEGYKLQFISNPTFPTSVSSDSPNTIKQKSLQVQVNKLLASGAISDILPSHDQLLSRIFTVKKSNGQDRLILDLSSLNTQINKVSFKMETQEHIRELICPNDFMASIDLSEAFHSIPIH